MRAFRNRGVERKLTTRVRAGAGIQSRPREYLPGVIRNDNRSSLVDVLESSTDPAWLAVSYGPQYDEIGLKQEVVYGNPINEINHPCKRSWISGLIVKSVR